MSSNDSQSLRKLCMSQTEANECTQHDPMRALLQVKLRALAEYLADVVSLNACASALAGVEDLVAAVSDAGEHRSPPCTIHSLLASAVGKAVGRCEISPGFTLSNHIVLDVSSDGDVCNKINCTEMDGYSCGVQTCSRHSRLDLGMHVLQGLQQGTSMHYECQHVESHNGRNEND